jgi:hypothetical protein
MVDQFRKLIDAQQPAGFARRDTIVPPLLASPSISVSASPSPSVTAIARTPFGVAYSGNTTGTACGTIFTERSGSIVVTSYTDSTTCGWFIRPSENEATSITFDSFDTEFDYDLLFVRVPEVYPDFELSGQKDSMVFPLISARSAVQLYQGTLPANQCRNRIQSFLRCRWRHRRPIAFGDSLRDCLSLALSTRPSVR